MRIQLAKLDIGALRHPGERRLNPFDGRMANNVHFTCSDTFHKQGL